MLCCSSCSEEGITGEDGVEVEVEVEVEVVVVGVVVVAVAEDVDVVFVGVVAWKKEKKLGSLSLILGVA